MRQASWYGKILSNFMMDTVEAAFSTQALSWHPRENHMANIDGGDHFPYSTPEHARSVVSLFGFLKPYCLPDSLCSIKLDGPR